MPADGQKEKDPNGEWSPYRTGDLLVTRDGIPLVVLGAPDTRDRKGKGKDGDPNGWAQTLRLLRGTLVVLAPEDVRGGPIMLHVPDAHPSRPTFLSPWGLGWITLPLAPGRLE